MPRPRQEPGKPVSAAVINQGVDAAETLDNLGASAGLGMVKTVRGRLLRLAVQALHIEIAQAPAGGVPARSGATPGSSTVTVQSFNGTSLSATPMTVTAYNVSATAAIGASKYLGIIKLRGYWWIFMAEC